MRLARPAALKAAGERAQAADGKHARAGSCSAAGFSGRKASSASVSAPKPPGEESESIWGHVLSGSIARTLAQASAPRSHMLSYWKPAELSSAHAQHHHRNIMMDAAILLEKDCRKTCLPGTVGRRGILRLSLRNRRAGTYASDRHH